MNRKYRSVFLWSTVSVIILGIGYGMIWLVSGLSNQNGEVVDIQINDKDFSAGPSDGEITLVEYSDFQCPACAVWYPILNQLKSDAEIKDQLRIIYRFFPLSQIHTNAELSSRSAYAAGQQNKFWEYHDLLFEKQEEWSGLSTSLARERESAPFFLFFKKNGADSQPLWLERGLLLMPRRLESIGKDLFPIRIPQNQKKRCRTAIMR